MGLVFDAKIEEGRICSDDGELFEIGSVVVTIVIAEGISEGGPGLVVGIKDTETIDSTCD